MSSRGAGYQPSPQNFGTPTRSARHQNGSRLTFCILLHHPPCVAPPTMSAFFPVDDTLGAAFIGFAVSCAAVGINTNQVFTYFRRYPEDRLAYKFLVLFVWTLELLDQALIGHAVYFYTISNYSQPLVLLLNPVPWTLIVQLTVGAFIGTIVHLCFAMRVWRFSKRNIPVTLTVVVLTLTEFALAIVYTVRSFQTPFLVKLPDLKVVASFALGTAVVTDVFTAGALCWFLRKFRTGHNKRADTLVNTLTIYAINSGAFTAAMSFLTLIFYDVNPRNFRFLASYFILSKLYAISFLCTLNTRKIVRGRGTEREDGRTTGASGSAANISASRFYVSHAPRTDTSGYRGEASEVSFTKGLEIGVHQEVSVKTDLEAQSGQYHDHPYMRSN
ncbi:hypothetical protein B0H15DRAFT_912510 [Mycena belliarum]|uniref:DUF6534 domain-containing protein n=1 Tax=Mycena belliarum TaxID=1033014 RepID=A0AAD6XIY2_9AGAR|nr:hypothetical protein B0H15DRAFT_912510 [Mycena belliae]